MTGGEVLVLNGIHDRACKIDAQRQFHVGNPTGAVAVELGTPGARLAGNIVFGRARARLRLHAENRFQHDALALRTERPMPTWPSTKGMLQDRAPPGPGVQSAELSGPGKSRKSSSWKAQENGQVDQQHLEPALIKTNDHGRQQQRAKTAPSADEVVTFGEVRWKKASALTLPGRSERIMRGRIFLAVCIKPLAQRAC